MALILTKVSEFPTLEVLADGNYLVVGLADGTSYKMTVANARSFLGVDIAGIAVPSTDPGTPIAGQSYWAGPGTYTNFLDSGGVAITLTEPLNLMTYNGTFWDVLEIPISIDLSSYAKESDLEGLEAFTEDNVVPLERKNLFNLARVVDGQSISVGGSLPVGVAVIAEEAGAGWARTGQIPVEEGETYTIQGVTIGVNSCFLGVFQTLDLDEEGTRINTNTIVIPAGYKFLVFTVESPTFTPVLEDIQVEKGSVATPVEPFGEATIPKRYIKDKTNLFDPLKVVEGQVLSFGSGSSEAGVYTSVAGDAPLAGWAFSGYIPVVPGKLYQLSGVTLNNANIGSFYDSSETPVGKTFVATNTNTYVAALKGNIFKAPEDAAFFAFNVTRPGIPMNREILKFSEYNSGKEFMPTDELFTDNDSNIAEVSPWGNDSIAWYGNSYTASHYAIKGKSWIRKLSNMVDYNIANFGNSGDSYYDLIERLRLTLNPFGGAITLDSLNPKYCVLALIANDVLSAQRGTGQLWYEREIEEAILIAKSYGMIPILGTDHVINNECTDNTIHEIARRHNVPYFSFGSKGLFINPSTYGPFWRVGHPGTRTNTYTFVNWLDFFSIMPRPKKSMKVFRLRTESAAKAVTELTYDNNDQRNVDWQEISVGEFGLTNPAQYDTISTTFANSSVANEYFTLMIQRNVLVGEKCLIDFTCPNIQISKAQLRIVSSADATVYIRDTRGVMDESYTLAGIRANVAYEVTKAVYDAFVIAPETGGFTDVAVGEEELTYKGKFKSYGLKDLSGYYLFFSGALISADFPAGTIEGPGGSYAYLRADDYVSQQPYEFYHIKKSRLVEIPHTYTDGIIQVNLDEAGKYLDFDRLSVVLVSASAMNISYAQLFTAGGVEKTLELPKYTNPKKGIDLYPVQSFGTSLGSWSSTGEVIAIPSTFRDYPIRPADNSHLELGWDAEGFPETLSRSIVIPEVNDFTKIRVRVVCRIFPKIFNGVDGPYTTATAQATGDSYDFGGVCIGLTTSTSGATGSILKKTIGFGWSERTFELLVGAFQTGGVLTIWRDEDDFDKRTDDFPLQIHSVGIEII